MNSVAERGCGFREQGCVYWEVPLGPGGAALEDYLLDPPVPVDVDGLGLTAVGVKLVELPDKHTGAPVVHLLDWVGEQHYACPADFLEEAGRYGLSRKIPRTLPFERLTPGSRLILVHRRGWIDNAADYVLRTDTGPVRPCPRHNVPHPETVASFDKSRNGRGELVRVPAGMCARLHWDDLPGGTPAPLFRPGAPDTPHPRVVQRTMPAFVYRGRVPPDGVQPQYRPAAIASFPLARLVVVKDDQGAHTETMERLRGAGHDVVAVEE